MRAGTQWLHVLFGSLADYSEVPSIQLFRGSWMDKVPVIHSGHQLDKVPCTGFPSLYCILFIPHSHFLVLLPQMHQLCINFYLHAISYLRLCFLEQSWLRYPPSMNAIRLYYGSMVVGTREVIVPSFINCSVPVHDSVFGIHATSEEGIEGWDWPREKWPEREGTESCFKEPSRLSLQNSRCQRP